MENGASEPILPRNDAGSDGTGVSDGDALFKNIMAVRADILDMETDEGVGGDDEMLEEEVQQSRTVSPAGAIVADEQLPPVPTVVESEASISFQTQEIIDAPAVQNGDRVEEEASAEQTSPPSKRQRTSSPSVDPEPAPYDPYSPPPGSKSIDEVLDEARSHLKRLSPSETYKLLTTPATPTSPPAILVDIRPVAQRREEGSIEGAIIIERNVLEWRFDPRSDSRLPKADRYDLKVVVFCSEGYTSSLAARSLQELGLENATDMVGGYKAWRRARLGSVSTGLPNKS